MQIQLLASIPFFQFYLETGEKKRLLKLLNYKKVQINANVLCQIPPLESTAVDYILKNSTTQGFFKNISLLLIQFKRL